METFERIEREFGLSWLGVLFDTTELSLPFLLLLLVLLPDNVLVLIIVLCCTHLPSTMDKSALLCSTFCTTGHINGED